MRKPACLKKIRGSIITIKIIRCPPTWDGWQCWEDGGRPGVVERMECPDYIYFKTFSLEPEGSCKGN